jgi:hypothetical protein
MAQTVGRWGGGRGQPWRWRTRGGRRRGSPYAQSDRREARWRGLRAPAASGGREKEGLPHEVGGGREKEGLPHEAGGGREKEGGVMATSVGTSHMRGVVQ